MVNSKSLMHYMDFQYSHNVNKCEIEKLAWCIPCRIPLFLAVNM